MRLTAQLVTCFLGLASCFGCASQSGDSDLPDESANERTVMAHLVRALREDGGSGRIYYRGNCQRGAGHPIFLPPLSVEAPPKGEKGLRAIREMLRGNRNVAVNGRKPRIITITIGSRVDPLLNTRIAYLRFTPNEQYNVVNAMLVVKRNRDLQAAMSKSGVEFLGLPILHAAIEPDPTVRHLPAAMTNVTLDEALDAIARTFGVIVLYGTCLESRQLQIRAHYIYDSAQDVPRH